jgi:hypothetical protein
MVTGVTILGMARSAVAAGKCDVEAQEGACADAGRRLGSAAILVGEEAFR